ncbi:translation initiation factor IF-2 [candidate division WOR-3 bacterium]|nr:translation initiation factor IF-2 [candidate division WOR-3 bacterium]
MKRVHEVANELGLSSKALIGLLKELGFKVNSPMSRIPLTMIKAAEKKFTQSKEAVKLKDQERKKLRAKARGFVPGAYKSRKLRETEMTKKRLRKTMTKIEMGKRTKKYQAEEIEEKKEIEKEEKIKIGEYVSVKELAGLLSVDPIDLISKCLKLGLMVTVNQRLDADTVSTIMAEYGKEAELIPSYVEEEEKIAGKLEPRSSVVTLMGHVDHGKTALLDYIRHTNVIQTESGGITQHIGAYRVKFSAKGGKDRYITFIDTPGHKAFTAMRARGARITDIVVLVIAADDGMMPQTIEALNHARDAGVSIIVAINKIDLPNVDPEKIEKQLLEHNLVTEKHGGDTLCCQVSAKTGKGINDLLETILMQAELLELKSRFEGEARGTIIESKLDKRKGIVATVIISDGILSQGDSFVAGEVSGKVRAMYDEWEKHKAKAYPSEPVQIVGFDAVSQVGDTLKVVKESKFARELSKERKELAKTGLIKGKKPVTAETLQKELEAGEITELKLIIKGDAAGSVEALSDSVEHLTEEKIKVNIIHKGIGEINESDILLAIAGRAIIIGYNVKRNLEAEKIAKEKKVEIRTYNIIYEAIDDIKLALKGLLPPKFEEYEIGKAEVKQIFKISNVGFITGCYVTEGKIIRDEKVRVKREEAIVYEGEIKSLKRIKEDVKEVKAGYECGVGFEEPVKLKPGDVIEAYGIKEM